MNAQATTLDYQQCMQNAALAFLERHQAEHLGDPSQLMDRTTSHLVESFEVVNSLALRLTIQAFNDLAAIQVRQRLDLKACDARNVVINDPVRGCSWSVPVYLIYEHLISAGRATRVTPAT
ncbi:hypothetical protein K6106_17965 [Pseudomonas fluorescens]|uniref:hypothetical protein n=1 Tax=Pseudomonas veronii TaxID=76761 RepID=UPI0021BFAB6C|nr:hypothetical protein [Pseudomonas veronii]MCT8963555.1 hypothetical protein [Pseudomonas veronii]UEL21909.1 hypothetical protein K6106_17965 [Pseudomonas fluorescens]